VITPNALVAIFSVAAASVALMILLRRRPATIGPPSKDGTTGLPIGFIRLVRRAGFRPDREGWTLMLAFTLAGFAGAGLGYVGSISLEKRPDFALLGLLAGFGGGVVLPLVWLRGRAGQRVRTLNVDFAMMLDLLQLALLGGQSLSAAWSTVTESIRDGMPQLASEMRAVKVEVSVGRGWSEALEATAGRSGCDDFIFLGRILEQSERFGTDLSHAIGTHADSIRHEEFQSIEEQAHRESVRMLFPMILLLLPATLLLMIGPLVVLLLEALNSVNAD
jgi:tight adherence protein C